MDFVKDLGDTSGTLDIPVDELGRFEILNGRVRLTLVTIREGAAPSPAVCLVWTVAALKKNRAKYSMLYELLNAGCELERAGAGEPLHH